MGIATKRNINFNILNPEKIVQIHNASIYLLEKVGMKVGGERALKLFKHHGASVSDNGLVIIPKSLVEKALETVPKEIILYNRKSEPAMILNKENQVYFGCHSDMLELEDPFTGKVRDFLLKDICLMCKIADYLPNIHFVLSVGLSKANLVHDVGVANHCNNVCPELVVLSDEIIEMIKHYSRGIEVNAKELTLELIEKVGPGGAYLTEEHTLENFKEIFYSDLFSRELQNPDKSDIRSKIRAKIDDISENHQVPPLDNYILKEFDKWYAKLAARA
jgi:trimethylamine:corrinoid methyltransferase-like protein